MDNNDQSAIDLRYNVYREEDRFVAHYLDVDVSGAGDTAESAVENLLEAVSLYYGLNSARN